MTTMVNVCTVETLTDRINTKAKPVTKIYSYKFPKKNTLAVIYVTESLAGGSIDAAAAPQLGALASDSLTAFHDRPLAPVVEEDSERR